MTDLTQEAARQRVAKAVIQHWTVSEGLEDRSGSAEAGTVAVDWISEQYLMVERGEGCCYFYNVSSADEAGNHHFGQEYPADWDIAEVVDLDTGNSHGLEARGYMFTDHPADSGGDYGQAIAPTDCPTCGRTATVVGTFVSGKAWFSVDDIDEEPDGTGGPTVMVKTEPVVDVEAPTRPYEDDDAILRCPAGHTWEVPVGDLTIKGSS